MPERLDAPGPPGADQAARAAESRGARALTVRAFVIGTAWMFIVAVLIPYNDYYLQSTFITGNLLPLGAVLILAVMVLLTNLLWQLKTIGTETMLLLIAAAAFATWALVFDVPWLNTHAYLALGAAGLCIPIRLAWMLATTSSEVEGAAEAEGAGDRKPEAGPDAPPGGRRGAFGEVVVAGALVVCAIASVFVTWGYCVGDETGWVYSVALLGAPGLILAMAILPLWSGLEGKAAPALSGGELIVVWILMIVGSGVPSSGLVRYVYPHMVAPIYLASPENAWGEKIHPHLPDAMYASKPPKAPAEDVPADDLARYEAEKAHHDRVVEKAYEGFRESELENFAYWEKDEAGEWRKKTIRNATLWQAIPWRAWLRPTAVWLAFVGLCYFMMVCVSVILRKQWEERERLNFPLTQLPVEMIEAPRRGKLINDFFRSKAMWIGFAIPVVVYTVNGLHKFYPNMPYIDTSIWVWRFFREKPWNTMRIGNMHIYFTVIGFTYLLPMEVAFSLWFWYFFSNFILLVGGYFDWTLGDGSWKWGLPVRQQMGAYVAYFLLLMWAGRRHLLSVLRRAVLLDGPEADRGEAMSYPLAVWGLIGSMVVVAFSAWYFFGVHYYQSLIYLGLVLLTLVVISRLVAQGGVIFVLHSWRPINLFETLFGGKIFATGTPGGKTTLAVFKHVEGFFVHDLRETSMPNMMNAFKLGGTMRIDRRKILLLIGVSILVAVLAASVSRMFLMYKYGGQDLRPYSFMTRPGGDFNWLAKRMDTPAKFQWDFLLATIWGAVLITTVALLSMSFYWWPLHPIGILLFPSYSIQCFWWSFFLGWLFKAMIVKYGGGRTFRALRPAFLGLILGDCFIGAVWIVVGLVLDERVISILPG